MKTIFPAAIANQTSEVYQARISVRSQAIYLLLLSLLVSATLSLPFVYIDVAVQSRGTFQSSLHRNDITAPTSGRLKLFAIKENQKIREGEVLAVIRSEMVELEIQGVDERKKLVAGFITDLETLVNMDPEALPKINTRVYQASHLEFQTSYQNQLALFQKQQRDFERAQTLFDSQSIAFVEYDEAKAQYDQAKTNLELLIKRKKAEWEQELTNHRQELLNLSNQKALLREKLDQYRVVAGVSGTVINPANLKAGDFVFPNQKLGEISPDSSLIAVTYLSPADIAFIEKGQKVNFQVDAYNYNQWGLASGHILDISEDLSLLSEREAGFLVTCVLDNPILRLKSGQEGEIKKGMTFNARFVIARRSLFQLLYDKVDDWLNPLVQREKT